jgi:hypothetical protein
MDHIRRDQTPQFSQPLSQILTMLAIVGGVVGLGYLAYPSVGTLPFGPIPISTPLSSLCFSLAWPLVFIRFCR